MRRLLLLLMLLLALSLPVNAADAEEIERAVPDSARTLMDGLGVDGFSAGGILERIGRYMAGHVRQELSAVLRPVGVTIAAAVLCSLGEGVQIKGGIDYVNLGACLVTALAAVGDVNCVVAMGRQAMVEMHEFSKVLLPSLCSAAAASGAISSSAAKYAFAAMGMDMLMSAAQGLLLPLVGAYTAALVASAAIGDSRLKGAVRLMKWLCTKGLYLLAAAFGALLGFVGLGSSGADAATAKAAKAIISACVPVVGKMVAGASESIAAGMELIRGALGAFGLGVVLAVCAAPFLAIGLRYLLFKAAAAVAGMIGGERIGSLVDGLGTAYGMVLALVGAEVLFMFISILSLVRTVV